LHGETDMKWTPKKAATAFTLLAATSGLTTGCGLFSSKEKDAEAEATEAAIENTSGPDTAQFLDARGAFEVEKGRIKGAALASCMEQNVATLPTITLASSSDADTLGKSLTALERLTKLKTDTTN